MPILVAYRTLVEVHCASVAVEVLVDILEHLHWRLIVVLTPECLAEDSRSLGMKRASSAVGKVGG